ncbi:unnamed protein product [Angiostrongylus costaricensis]|uniref:Uncharacterized protein n=1 Tax=Angiostrongylus costaricensis TaxID=334426 RepID=A0A0R3PN10_ANGCS|nr:unnamed protein product [Angiostrongylus costaricensis]
MSKVLQDTGWPELFAKTQGKDMILNECLKAPLSEVVHSNGALSTGCDSMQLRTRTRNRDQLSNIDSEQRGPEESKDAETLAE